MSTENSSNGQDRAFRPGDFPDEERAKELAEQVLALSPSGRSLVIDALVQQKAAPVVSTTCEELGVPGVPGVLEEMAAWCSRSGAICTDEGNRVDAADYRWQESLLRAFQQALTGPPSRD